MEEEVEVVEVVEAVEAVAWLRAAVAWMARASPSPRGEVAAQDKVMYCQKVLLVHSP